MVPMRRTFCVTLFLATLTALSARAIDLDSLLVKSVGAKDDNVTLDNIEPRKPTQNAFIDYFNATFRQRCLDAHWFADIVNSIEKIEYWRNDYNTEGPHRSITRPTPTPTT